MDQGNTEAPNLRFLLFSFRTSRNSGSDRTFYADAHLHLHEKNAPGAFAGDDTFSVWSHDNCSD